jgi:hypothetical protein
MSWIFKPQSSKPILSKATLNSAKLRVPGEIKFHDK